MAAIFLSLFFGFVPMLCFAALVYWIDRYEKEPLFLLGGVFFWGAIVASAGAFLINTILGVGIFAITGSETATDLTTGTLIAPIIEESLKGLAVCLVFLFFRREFDSILDGIIYAAVAALGFAATENAYYIYSYGYQESGYSGLFFLVFVRVILVGWQHPFFTAFTGIGLAITRLNRNWVIKVLAPAVGWSLAVATHSFHNFLASAFSSGAVMLLGSVIDWSGWLIMFLFVLWAVWREKQYLSVQLKGEIGLGILTERQYRVACSASAQTWARLMAIFEGKYQATSRFFQLCGELAHKKQQLMTIGEEVDNSRLVAGIRSQISQLSSGISLG